MPHRCGAGNLGPSEGHVRALVKSNWPMRLLLWLMVGRPTGVEQRPLGCGDRKLSPKRPRSGHFASIVLNHLCSEWTR